MSQQSDTAAAQAAQGSPPPGPPAAKAKEAKVRVRALKPFQVYGVDYRPARTERTRGGKAVACEADCLCTTRGHAEQLIKSGHAEEVKP